jgi:hypothetical protein
MDSNADERRSESRREGEKVGGASNFLPLRLVLVPRSRERDLSRLGIGERNLAKPKAREGRASGRERVQNS